MAFPCKFNLLFLAVGLGVGLGASQAGAIDPSNVQEIPACLPNFCGYLYDLDGVEANFGPTNRTCVGCSGAWAPVVRIETSQGAIDTLTVSMAAINHPANPHDLSLDAPVSTVVISGDSTVSTPGCYSSTATAPYIACTYSMNDSRFFIRHLPKKNHFDFGGAAVTAFIDDATNQIERYHITFGGAHQ